LVVGHVNAVAGLLYGRTISLGAEDDLQRVVYVPNGVLEPHSYFVIHAWLEGERLG